MGQEKSLNDELASKCDLNVTKLNWQKNKILIVKLLDLLKLFQVETSTVRKIYYIASY